MTSLRDRPLKTVWEPRDNVNDCAPMFIGTSKAVAPAGALKDVVSPPEVIVTVPAEVRRATTKMESDIWSHPVGLPPAVVSVESQLTAPGVGRYQ